MERTPRAPAKGTQLTCRQSAEGTLPGCTHVGIRNSYLQSLPCG